MASIMYLIVIFILSSIYKESLSVRFKVSSTQSVVAALGSDVVLPCRLTPEMNAEKMEIRWFKPMYQPYVHLYINGKDDYSIQMPQFTNRTELIKENITRGVFPLRIRNVTAQDSGEYYCFVESSDHHGRTIVQLNVTAVGSLPVIFSKTYESNDTAICESYGWLPEASLIWTDNLGNQVIPSKEKVFKDENSCYCIMSIISLPNASNITCTVSNSVKQSQQSSKQILETGHPETCRDLYSRYVVFYPCLAVILLSCGCICLLLKRLRTKDEEIRSKDDVIRTKDDVIKQLRAAQCDSVNGISAAGISHYGWNSSDHVTYGNVPSVPLNGISSA
ncbi:putative selection and upkeep of intraepithelial T-cells protein 1 homolog isoform X2 [Xenopus laevis]|uniref:Selection and upkeep of intraepithelial T-cells protein 1 homolog isoform X2 n=1 Tax=Xenopus laevis TaxID=8355 RepID=A0A8J1LKA5_XENLA|nr:putative selection and upkeep of intraepithelial T-cells protein 1 homolog isoform X2 [Xenopus laevis]